MSEDAVDDIPMVDFIYIDGNHSYDFVKRDIELYYPKVKDGGVIGGHDIYFHEVQKAVFEFVIKNNLLNNLHAKYPDWWIIKEKL